MAAPFPEGVREALRGRAVQLRSRGLSYSDIEKVLPVSRSTLSLWLRGVPLTKEQELELRRRRTANGYRTGLANRARRLRKEAEIRRQTAAEMGNVTDRDLFVAGVIAYAAEGSKKKPWRTSQMTAFINSDPRMIRLFLRWLELIGIHPSSITFRLSIHESADVTAALSFWSDVVGSPATRFRRTTLKRGNPKTLRRNVGAQYRGCLIVAVAKSGDLNKRLEGWFDALVKNLSIKRIPRPAFLETPL